MLGRGDMEIHGVRDRDLEDEAGLDVEGSFGLGIGLYRAGLVDSELESNDRFAFVKELGKQPKFSP